MPELNPDWGDPDYEQFLYDLRRDPRMSDRFVITHYDASLFVDELMEAALEAKLNIIDVDGLPAAYSTVDADKVDHYKRLMFGYGWQVFDKLDGSFTEAPERK